MGKNPAFLFYPNDWTRDTRVLSPEAKGAWIDILCDLHFANPRGKKTYDISSLSRIIGDSPEKIEVTIKELQERNTCDIQINNEKITISSRRFLREEKQKRDWVERKARHREKGGGDPERWTALRVKILQRDDYVCGYCGRRAYTVDHIFPKIRGGDESDENLVSCCKKCNLKKQARTPEEAGMSFWNKDKQKSHFLVTSPLTSSLKKKKIPSPPNPEVKELIDYFSEACEESRGFKPAIRGGQDGKNLKEFLKSHSLEDGKELIDFYLEDKKGPGRNGVSVSSCLTPYSINRWLENRPPPEGSNDWRFK